MSAWYDGGCEIDKFTVQYRARGQLEWILISNNILKDQATLLIRDLMPATSYELLVVAHNQVGPTEVKYRFTTLDADGKQVFNGLSLFGNQLTSDAYQDSDYADESSWRELWPSSSRSDGSGLFMRSLLFFRHLLNSPLALLCSLSLCILLFVLFLVHKRPSAHSSSSLSSTANTLASSSATNKSSSSASCNGRRLSIEANTTILGDMEVPLSMANGSLTESPARLPLQQVGAFQSASDCNYQSFCANQQQSNMTDYGPVSSMNAAQNDCITSPYVHPAYGATTHQVATTNHYSLAGQTGPYASVQRSATMEPSLGQTGASLMSGQQTSEHQQQQECLMQMLMMGSRPQQQQQSTDPQHTSYVTAALTTLARNKGHLSVGAPHSNYHAYASQPSASNHQATVTLGRPTSDYQRPNNSFSGSG